MKIVCISGPFRAPDMFAVQENVMAAMKLGLAVARLGGAFPFIPHANTMFFTGAAPDQTWLDGDLEILRRCDAILMTSNWQQSSGASAERALALRLGLPVFYTVDEVQEWLHEQTRSGAEGRIHEGFQTPSP